jgi:hypothetical protein
MMAVRDKRPIPFPTPNRTFMTSATFCSESKSSKKKKMSFESDENDNDTVALVEDPPQRAQNAHATTNVETLMHLFKGEI